MLDEAPGRFFGAPGGSNFHYCVFGKSQLGIRVRERTYNRFDVSYLQIIERQEN